MEIIALDFYDGATEGFAQSIGDHGPCYFKLIAWDDAQDQRLFALAKVERETLEELVAILVSQDNMPTSLVWLPKWKFQNDRDRKRADDIVNSSQEKLRSSGLLILGASITDTCAKEIEFDEEIARHVWSSLNGSQPDKLSKWLSYFE